MELCERFEPLMAEAVYLATSNEGLELSCSEVFARLEVLVKEEQGKPWAWGSQDLKQKEHISWLEQARFAVFAFVDEQILNSERNDASSWMSYALQSRYFATASAGQIFFVRLGEVLTKLGVAVSNSSGKSLSLVERLELAKFCRKEPGFSVLEVFALCLLYGFRGELYAQKEDLAKLRSSCRDLLVKPSETPKPSAPKSIGVTSRFFWRFGVCSAILVPLLVCLAFWLYCANLLTTFELSIP